MTADRNKAVRGECLIVAAGGPLCELISRIVARLIEPRLSGDAGAIVVATTLRATPESADFPDLVRDAVATLTDESVSLFRADSQLRSAIPRRGSDWARVGLSQPGLRLDHVDLRREIAEASMLIGVMDLARSDPRDRVIALGIWSAFAKPGLRLGARWSEPRESLAVEIAAAVRPAAVLLAGRWGNGGLVIGSADQVVAELGGLALGRMQADPDVELAGPWEDARVQRATDLQIGVETPSEIELSAMWLGEEGPERDAFTSYVERMGARIGVILN